MRSLAASRGSRGRRSSTEGPERLAGRVVDALNRKDLDRLMALYADEASLEFPSSPPVSGKAAIRRSFERFFREWDETVTLDAVAASGNVVAAEGQVEGRHLTLHLKIRGRVPTPPRTYRHAFAAFWTLRNGKIVRHRVYYDARELVRQLVGS